MWRRLSDERINHVAAATITTEKEIRRTPTKVASVGLGASFVANKATPYLRVFAKIEEKRPSAFCSICEFRGFKGRW